MKRPILYTYRQKLFFSFIILFTSVIITVGVFQYFHERRLMNEQFQDNLVSYARIVASALPQQQQDLETLSSYLPQDLRITVIKHNGKVIFDNVVEDLSTLDNHINRPEIQSALNHGVGFNIRYSNSLQQDYYYAAISSGEYLVRTSMAYTIDLEQTYLRPERIFAYFILALFIIIIIFLILITKRLSLSIEALRKFSLQSTPNNAHQFPDDELGDIGRRISELYEKNNKHKQRLQREKDKLIKHFHYTDNGIAIFSKDKELIYNNSLFVQYAGCISPDNFEIRKTLATPEFQKILKVLEEGNKTTFSEVFMAGERGFVLKAIIFDDKSFEIMITDITLAEKNRKIKRDMTQNIAHELKTPVSTIKGYLETLQSIKVSPEKQQHFLERAKLQADRLSELVTDIAMITKIEESPTLYPKEQVSLNTIIEQASDSSKLKVNISLAKGSMIFGSSNLLHTIFQNLVNNANRYAGEHAEIHIDCYLQDEQYYYFTVYDTGKGVPDKYLNRIFERFYRIEEGRNRNDGGTGLGLSLVKNAVLMHNGDIQAKNRAEGGLQFLFTLKKN